MNNIEWKEGAVCYAGREQYQICQDGRLCGDYFGAYTDNLEMLSNTDDFQLNELIECCYITKSELDTEEKYNTAVDELRLFATLSNREGNQSYEHFCSESFWCLGIDYDKSFAAKNKNYKGVREVSLKELIVLGKLKRLMNERESSAVSKVNLDIERAVRSTISAELDKPKIAAQYLNECIQVQVQRGKQYDSTGTGERSFDAVAKAYNAITGQSIKGSDVCLILTCVKAVRQYSNPNRLHEDSLLDLVSYASLWAEELNKELK